MRVLSGPNRGGKTLAGAVIDVCVLLGHDHFRPWRKFKLPTLVWAVALDNKRLGRVLRQKIKELLPGEAGRDYKEYLQDGIFVMSRKWGGSELHMMSCEAGPERFKGAECDHIHLDEEPNPRGNEIFNECFARIGPDRRLDIAMTFTPDQGATWSYDRLFDPNSDDYLKGVNGEKIVEFFTFSLWDCDKETGGHLSRQQILERFHAYPRHELKARFYGQYSRVGANVYFNAEHLEKAAERAALGKPTHTRILIDSLRQTRIEHGPFPEWQMYEERIPGERYITGIDVSGGNRKDRSVAYTIATGLKKRLPDGKIVEGNGKPRRVCRYRSNKIDPEQFAREIVFPMLVYYNQALAVPERNGEYGGAFLQALRDPPASYDNLYSDLRYDKVKMEWKGGLGWHTSDSTRGMILAAHEQALREEWDVYTPSCTAELGTVIEKHDPHSRRTRVEAAYGAKDDEVFACGFALAANIQDPPVVIPPIEECAEIYEEEYA